MEELKKLSEHVYVLPFDTYSDRPNLGYIKGDRFSVRVDAGNSKAHNELFVRTYRMMEFPDPELCIITHWHWDHTFGLDSLNCQSISSQKTYDKLKEVSKWEWTSTAMLKRLINREEIPFCDKNIRKEYKHLRDIYVKCPDHTYNGNIRLNLGNLHVNIMETESPHSSDATLILVEEDRLLFVADADCEDFYHGGIYDKKRLKSFIAKIESLDFDTYVLGHADEEAKENTLKRLNDVYVKLKEV